MNAKTFGRRASAASSPTRRTVKAPVPVRGTAQVPDAQLVLLDEAKPVAAQAPAEAALAAPHAVVPVDEELRRWTDERRKTLPGRLPWKQFSLFASLSFGIASFVLPDSVNGAVDYLLWGLSAASFIVWLNGRKKKTA